MGYLVGSNVRYVVGLFDDGDIVGNGVGDHVSLMPNGLLNGLNEVQLKNLFAYLRSTTPPF